MKGRFTDMTACIADLHNKPRNGVLHVCTLLLPGILQPDFRIASYLQSI
jgi:hypothetical protein